MVSDSTVEMDWSVPSNTVATDAVWLGLLGTIPADLPPLPPLPPLPRPGDGLVDLGDILLGFVAFGGVSAYMSDPFHWYSSSVP